LKNGETGSKTSDDNEDEKLLHAAKFYRQNVDPTRIQFSQEDEEIRLKIILSNPTKFNKSLIYFNNTTLY